MSRVASVAWTTRSRASRSSSSPRVWSSSASLSSTASSGTLRLPPAGGRAGQAASWACMSGEASSRHHGRRSGLTATDDWVRGRVGREPSRTARQQGQAQFHCGNPPPAADPSTRTHMLVHPRRPAVQRSPESGRGAERCRPAPRPSGAEPVRLLPVVLLPVVLLPVVLDPHVGGHLGGHRDLLEGRGLPLRSLGLRDSAFLLHARHLPPDESMSSGSEKTNIACPCGPPIIPGRNPSTQAPQPTGTARYCLPSTL